MIELVELTLRDPTTFLVVLGYAIIGGGIVNSWIVSFRRRQK